jgi:peptidoglycan/LPS O-acetylase OafA/YrhL
VGQTGEKNHIACLDGVRGLLAIWVFWGHICLAVGAKIPILSTPPLAVDLFMLLSGFLMAYHWEIKKSEQVDIKRKVLKFWIRRFFRIAPLYYCLLILSFWFTPHYLEITRNLNTAFPPPWASNLIQYKSPTDYTMSLLNVLSHISFAFGFIPQFVSNNALPDWSLSLEMQFYLFFPFLMYFMRPSRMLFYVLGAVGISLVMPKIFGLYMASGLLGNFPQPSFILFKIHVFASGMTLGCLASRHKNIGESSVVYWLAFFFPLLFLSKSVLLFSVLIAALICLHSQPVQLLNNLLSNKVFKFMGDISYSVYLIHVTPLYLLLDRFLHWRYFVESGSSVRFIITVFATTPIVFTAACGLHKFIEIPGIEIGKRLTKREVARGDLQAIRTPVM